MRERALKIYELLLVITSRELDLRLFQGWFLHDVCPCAHLRFVAPVSCYGALLPHDREASDACDYFFSSLLPHDKGLFIFDKK